MGSVPTIGQPDDLSSTTPAAPSGSVNNVVQAEAPTPLPTTVVRHFSSYTPPATATTPGAVPTPPNDPTQFLNGQLGWAVPPGTGGGGGSNDDISYYLSPSTITPPSGLSWAYHVNASYSFNANGAMVIVTYSSADGEALGKSISSGDFDLIACMAANVPLTGSGAIAYGVYLEDPGSGKSVQFFIDVASGAGATLYLQNHASFTGSSTTVASRGVAIGTSCPIWFRINYSSGKYTFYLGVDGQSWDEFAQVTATSYLPVEATNGGLLWYNSASTPAHCVVPHFTVGSYSGS